MRYLSLLLLLWACQPASAPQQPTTSNTTVFINVNVLDVRNGQIINSQDVYVDDGKISSVSGTLDRDFGNATVIDGSDKYLMPGLAEMHAHIPRGEGDITMETLFLYLSNGVTTIRGMLGDSTHLPLREKARNNEILSPRIFTSSPSLNGYTVQSADEAREKVTQYQQDGYDFLKIHPGIKLEAFEQLVSTAQEVGIPYAGHVPVDVGINRALESGYASVDHIDGFLEGLVPESANVNPAENGFFGYNFTELTDETLLPDLIQKTVDNQVWVVPTQSLFDRWFSPLPTEELAAQPEMKYMPASTLEDWVGSKNNLIGSEGYSPDMWRKFNDLRLKMLKSLQDNGYGILLGSDAPQVFNVPGFSIHREMKGMLDAGMTPIEILQSGTLNPAKYFGLEGSFGEIEVGASADLILIDGDPLQDLANIRNPSGVMVRGRWLDREQINKRLAEIADRRKDI